MICDFAAIEGYGIGGVSMGKNQRTFVWKPAALMGLRAGIYALIGDGPDGQRCFHVDRVCTVWVAILQLKPSALLKLLHILSSLDRWLLTSKKTSS